MFFVLFYFVNLFEVSIMAWRTLKNRLLAAVILQETWKLLSRCCRFSLSSCSSLVSYLLMPAPMLMNRLQREYMQKMMTWDGQQKIKGGSRDGIGGARDLSRRWQDRVEVMVVIAVFNILFYFILLQYFEF